MSGISRRQLFGAVAGVVAAGAVPTPAAPNRYGWIGKIPKCEFVSPIFGQSIQDYNYVLGNGSGWSTDWVKDVEGTDNWMGGTPRLNAGISRPALARIAPPILSAPAINDEIEDTRGHA